MTYYVATKIDGKITKIHKFSSVEEMLRFVAEIKHNPVEQYQELLCVWAESIDKGDH